MGAVRSLGREEGMGHGGVSRASPERGFLGKKELVSAQKETGGTGRDGEAVEAFVARKLKNKEKIRVLGFRAGSGPWATGRGSVSAGTEASRYLSVRAVSPGSGSR